LPLGDRFYELVPARLRAGAKIRFKCRLERDAVLEFIEEGCKSLSPSSRIRLLKTWFCDFFFGLSD
jgi:hypothetical protein